VVVTVATVQRDGQPGATSVGQVPMERLHTIFDGMFDGVWLVGRDGRTTYANGAIAAMLGTTAAEMHGQLITEFLSEEFRETAEALIDAQREGDGERVDLRFLRSNGDDLWTLVAASPILTAEGTYVGSMLNVSDVTGKRAAQNQALQSQKLEAIGAFAAGISHDFNNLLTSIRGFAELASAEVPDDSPVRADLDQVIASADRARGITGKLLAFIHRQVLVPVPLDPAVVIGELLPILRPLLSEDIRVVLEAERGGPSILIDPVALEQILVNLAVNAHDAMPAGGTLTIRLDDVKAHGRQALGAVSSRPHSVRFRISDTGVGMDEPTLGRIFDPFFTTKDPDRGTGLGLSTVYGLVTQSGGSIHADSTPGAGSTFTILLPVVVGNVPVPDAAPVSAVDAAVGVVLMVEDWVSVREFARRVLAKAGHTLIVAGTADVALQRAADWPGTIDVLLTDVVMPGMHGPALAAKLLETRPNLAIVYMSGYTANALVGAPALGPKAIFLAKPFTAELLLDAVSEGLRVARASGAA
jgi:two-component system, cell cycle sensor histidine kinase and response regulator CckA